MAAAKRLDRIVGQLDLKTVSEKGLVLAPVKGEKKKDDEGTITVIDNRTGKKYDFAIWNGTINAEKLFAVKGPNGYGLRIYDPGYMNTASATSRITFINGTQGILRYRGYPIEQLAAKSTFLEVAFLLIYGELPNREQLAYWNDRVMKHTFIHEDLKQQMKTFRYDAHPMGILISAIAAMSTLHPEANPALAGQEVYNDINLRNKQIHRIVGTMPTIAAYAYRQRMGRPYVNPSEGNLSYCENYLYMLDKLSASTYRPHPALVRALDVLFILHADHELNCSTAGMRHHASSGVDVYTCLAASSGALYGPRHGGANEAVLRMLEKIGKVENVATFVDQVKNRKVKLMGFGHRVYKNYDPRARIVQQVANEVFQVLGKEPLIEVAIALEKYALNDPFFIERKLYPNVDFYSGLIYKAMGFPTDYFPVLFAVPRAVGWLAHWVEFLDDPENRIVRPRQVYLGENVRDYVAIDSRTKLTKAKIESEMSAEGKRRLAGTL